MILGWEISALGTQDRRSLIRRVHCHLVGRVILVPSPVVAEVGYLLGRAGGTKIEAAFQRSIAQETLTVIDLELAESGRIAELVETYADFTYAGFRSSRAGNV